MIIKKSPEEIERMAAAGAVLVRTMNLLQGKVRPGVTTKELDEAAERFIRSQGATPAFKGYRGFPGSICASPNAMVVHGIPGPYTLEPGDLLSLDVGVTLDGFVADSAITITVGEGTEQAKDLIDACYAGLEAAIEQCHAGNRLGDISHAVQTVVEERGYGVVRSLVGHGVGRTMHEEPQIPNYGPPGRGPKLAEGMVFAIEPMITVGDYNVEGGDDGWAIYTRDGSLAAHCEHTVAITKEGPRVLTRRVPVQETGAR
jgi:methionyl aminopeptidase